nr:hypothetical protein [Nostoc sp. CreGUA01]
MERWGGGEMGRWPNEGESNSSFPPSPHPLILPSSFHHAQCPVWPILRIINKIDTS